MGLLYGGRERISEYYFMIGVTWGYVPVYIGLKKKEMETTAL